MPFDHESMNMVIPDWRDTPSELTERSAQDIADMLRLVHMNAPEYSERVLRLFVNLTRSFPQFMSIWEDAESGLFDDMLKSVTPAKLAELVVSADEMAKEMGREGIPAEIVEKAKFLRTLTNASHAQADDSRESVLIELTPELHNFLASHSSADDKLPGNYL